jgi:hypothetical protein
MLSIIVIGVVLIGIVAILRVRAPGNLGQADLGSMSERWLAEHRASRYP